MTAGQDSHNPLRWDQQGEIIDAVAAVAEGEDIHIILERLLRGAWEVLGARYGALGLTVRSGVPYEFIHVGMDESVVARMDHPPKGLGVLASTAHAETPIRLDDLTKHPASVGFPEGHPPMHTFVGAPIRLRGESVGTFYFTEKMNGEPFTDEDLRRLVAFASVAGIAIENARLFERSKRREEWLRASNEVTTSLLLERESQEILDLVARRAVMCARADGVAIMLEDSNGRMVVSSALGEYTDGFQGMVADDSWKYSMHARSSGQPVVIDDLGALGDAEDPNFRNLGTAVLLPLVAAGETFGAIALIRNHGRGKWDDEDINFAEAFAGQTAVVMVLARAQREQERLAIYVDRDRIARDLHDLVIQRLFATGLTLQTVQRRNDVPLEVATKVDNVVGELDATVREIRQTIFELAHSHSQSSSLRPRVIREVATASESLGFQPHVLFEGPLDSVVPSTVVEHLVAALREALSNVVKHARASWVDIRLELLGDDVVLTVEDDGVGIFPTHRRSGIKNLEQRASELGGSSDIEATRPDGSGTRLIWRASIL